MTASYFEDRNKARTFFQQSEAGCDLSNTLDMPAVPAYVKSACQIGAGTMWRWMLFAVALLALWQGEIDRGSVAGTAVEDGADAAPAGAPARALAF